MRVRPCGAWAASQGKGLGRGAPGPLVEFARRFYLSGSGRDVVVLICLGSTCCRVGGNCKNLIQI